MAADARDAIARGPIDVVRTLYAYRWRWIVPAMLFTAASACYALVRDDQWKATQALVARNEAVVGDGKSGQFVHADEMKTTQETLVELCLSRSVLEAALSEVGPAADIKRVTSEWPTAADVAALRDAIEIVPPSGATFGATEVFYLTVIDGDPDRAARLATAICGRLEQRFQQLRDAHASSVIGELEKTVSMAEADWRQSNDRLAELENRVGARLPDLRMLSESVTSSGSDLRRRIEELDQELLQGRKEHGDNRQLLDLLKAAQTDSDKLLATPSRLLASQPALDTLKNGLLEAQLAAARFEGTMTESHPQVAAARSGALKVASQIKQELEVAIRGLEVDLRLSDERLSLIENRLNEATASMTELASIRLEYSNLVAATKQRLSLYEEAQRKLAEARANQASAKTASLVTRLDEPDLGVGPVGLSRAMTILLGAAGGLLGGFGLVLLTATAVPPTERAPRRVVAPLPRGKTAVIGDWPKAHASSVVGEPLTSVSPATKAQA